MKDRMPVKILNVGAKLIVAKAMFEQNKIVGLEPKVRDTLKVIEKAK